MNKHQKLQTDFYIIRAISNLHVGSGDADFGIIDKHVQRDPVTGLPVIFGSSLKGALRQLFETFQPTSVDAIFGSENPSKRQVSDGEANEKEGDTPPLTKSATATLVQKELIQGTYRFHDAHLLALPVRTNHRFYYRATCPELLQDFMAEVERQDKLPEAIRGPLQQLAGKTVNRGAPIHFNGLHSSLLVEDLTATFDDTIKKSQLQELDRAILPAGETLFGDRLLLLSAIDFQERCQELPTVARNYLENGISKNLWYEEIVPRESVFYAPITAPDSTSGFESTIATAFGHQIQVGGNATVGYGLCTLKKLSL